jgi:hypothetical protein
MWRGRDGEKVEEERWGRGGWHRRKRQGMNEEERWLVNGKRDKG